MQTMNTPMSINRVVFELSCPLDAEADSVLASVEGGGGRFSGGGGDIFSGDGGSILGGGGGSIFPEPTPDKISSIIIPDEEGCFFPEPKPDKMESIIPSEGDEDRLALRTILSVISNSLLPKKVMTNWAGRVYDNTAENPNPESNNQAPEESRLNGRFTLETVPDIEGVVFTL